MWTPLILLKYPISCEKGLVHDHINIKARKLCSQSTINHRHISFFAKGLVQWHIGAGIDWWEISLFPKCIDAVGSWGANGPGNIAGN